jgi:hypothetical protein
MMISAWLCPVAGLHKRALAEMCSRMPAAVEAMRRLQVRCASCVHVMTVEAIRRLQVYSYYFVSARIAFDACMEPQQIWHDGPVIRNGMIKHTMHHKLNIVSSKRNTSLVIVQDQE